MAEATQFCIGLENKLGMLGTLCQKLRAAEINIDALFVSRDEDCCWVNFVASPIDRARETLAEHGYNFYTEQVLVFEIKDKPGELERISTALADANVNIIYVYGSCTGDVCTLVLNVDDLARAAEIVGA